MTTSKNEQTLRKQRPSSTPPAFHFDLRLTPTFRKGHSPLYQLISRKDGFSIIPPAMMAMKAIPTSENVTKIKLTMGDKENTLTFFSNSPTENLSLLVTKCNLAWAFRCKILLSLEEGGKMGITIQAPSHEIYEKLKFNFDFFDK